VCTKLRKTNIDVLGDVPFEMHICHFYQTKKDLLDILVPYFKAGLEHNESCMWITSEPLNTEGAKLALESELGDLNSYIKRKQLAILKYDQWYLKAGQLDFNKTLLSWIDKEEEALGNGFDGLRLSGNTSWIESNRWKNLMYYEKAVDIAIVKHRMLAICSYPQDKYKIDDLVDISSRHQNSLIKKSGKWRKFGAGS